MDIHKSSDELAEEIKEALLQITVGARYRHYKSADMIYEVTNLGFTEATNELCVIYQAQYGEKITFIRPLTVWLEQVQWEDQIIPRFTKL